MQYVVINVSLYRVEIVYNKYSIQKKFYALVLVLRSYNYIFFIFSESSLVRGYYVESCNNRAGSFYHSVAID